ncbi:MAG: cytochrome P450 [Myxococcota bacterium]
MTLPPFHPFSLEYTANPRPWFAAFHRDGRFAFVPEMNAVAVHAYDAVRAFCDHPQMSRNPADAGIENPEQDAARMARWPTLESQMKRTVAGDPQGLARMRELLAPDFKPAMIRKMAATVKDVVEKVCAPLAWEREVDMVSLVQAVPLMIISKLLGIEEATADAELFLRAAPDYFRGVNPLADDVCRDQAELAAQQMFDILGRTVEDRRREPRLDMVTQVLEIAAGMGNVSTEDVVRALVILVAAGTDTTRLTTSLAARTLLAHPREFDRLRANRDDVKNAVMELLRYESPTKFLVRVAVEDVQWQDQTIPRGTIVLLSIMGAGWDPEVFPEPERFDVTRDLRGSLNFGFGSGYCLGVHLARLQVGTLLHFMLDHLPSTATVDEAGMRWDPRNLFLREITALPVHVR